MLRTIFANPVSRAFVTLLAAIAMVLTMFVVYVINPEHYGVPNINFNTSTVYYFADSWTLEYDYLKISFPADSFVIPGLYNGQVYVVLIIAPENEPGSLSLDLPQEYQGQLPSQLTDNLQQALLVLYPTDFRKAIRDSGDTILLMTPDADLPIRQLDRELEAGRELLTGYNLFGYENRLPPTPETILLQLKGDRLGTFSYYEDATVRIKSSSNTFSTIEFIHPQLNRSYYPPDGYQTSTTVYTVFLLLTSICMAAFLTSGLDGRLPVIKGDYNPLITTLAVCCALAWAWLLTAYQQLFEPEHLWLASLWLLGLIMVGAWMYKSKMPLKFIGLSWQGLASGIPVCVVLAAILTLGATTRLPVSIDFNPELFAGIMVTALLREAFLRGFLQRVLAHWLSPTLGVLLVALAWTGIVLSFGFEASGHNLLLGGISVLGTALLVGYIYQRTDNVLIPGLLAGLLHWLPLAMIF